LFVKILKNDKILKNNFFLNKEINSQKTAIDIQTAIKNGNEITRKK